MTSKSPENSGQSLPSGATNANANVAMDEHSDGIAVLPPVNFESDRFPYCIVWTPIPVLTWFFPMIGHMGICTSIGVIRDFAGPYYVSEDSMGFGRPTRYLRLHPKNVVGGSVEWDEAVAKASVLYGTRMHNLFCDNCHSHVATALIAMRYKRRTSWNMVILAFWMFFCGRYVGFFGFVKTWLPFVIVVSLCVFLGIYL
ncbi:PREDICTED: transmembrane protein 222 [Rhagoletis zephyria]|uniref:transmembrane protein 222 n=1 Tax=Rhagoletis zephyria TaxID=28612 RepID=UPI0008117FB7|nr:PREDICTED: transmembrane protein 222 [Rhagoletis zephyria]XP_036328337.1 transmembrane protein 222 [Rhagoletis pomonella]